MAITIKKTAKPEVEAVDQDDIDIRMVELDDIEPNAYNPNSMEAELFEGIVAEVKKGGMQQPILVRPHPQKPGKFEIVDGEHRWKSSKIAGKKRIAVVVVPYTESEAKVRTLAMNGLRGQNIPIRLARLLVDLHKEYSPQQIRQMTGIGEEEQVSVLDLLKVPDFKPGDGVKLSAQEVERPISVNLLLLPDEHQAYTLAMKKAMKYAGDDVTALIGHEVAEYDQAMKAAMGIAGAKLRNVALAVICQTFNSLPKDQQLTIAKTAHAKIYDKLANDAAHKEAKKQAADKTS
jgi:ParB/RepB/Spo0J family partition protein